MVSIMLSKCCSIQSESEASAFASAPAQAWENSGSFAAGTIGWMLICSPAGTRPDLSLAFLIFGQIADSPVSDSHLTEIIWSGLFSHFWLSCVIVLSDSLSVSIANSCLIAWNVSSIWLRSSQLEGQSFCLCQWKFSA